MSDATHVFGFNQDTGAKHTSHSEWALGFLAALTPGAAVFEERREWDTARREQVVTIKQIGFVRAGDFGHAFERTARFY